MPDTENWNRVYHTMSFGDISGNRNHLFHDAIYYKFRRESEGGYLVKMDGNGNYKTYTLHPSGNDWSISEVQNKIIQVKWEIDELNWGTKYARLIDWPVQ
jgi:hypothetical protein